MRKPKGSTTQSVRDIESMPEHWLNKYPRKIRWAHVKRVRDRLRKVFSAAQRDWILSPRGNLPPVTSEAWRNHLRVGAEVYHRRLARYEVKDTHHAKS